MIKTDPKVLKELEEEYKKYPNNDLAGLIELIKKESRHENKKHS